jgi:hypothetical protein
MAALAAHLTDERSAWGEEVFWGIYHHPLEVGAMMYTESTIL